MPSLFLPKEYGVLCSSGTRNNGKSDSQLLMNEISRVSALGSVLDLLFTFKLVDQTHSD